ncbi:MAG: ATP-binding protein [Aggregatilineales bacterium]
MRSYPLIQPPDSNAESGIAMSEMPITSQSHTPQQLDVLVRVSQMLSTLDLDAVLSSVVSLTTEVVGASRGTFFLFDEQGGNLTLQRFMAARNYNPDMREYVSERVLSEGLAGWVYARREAAVVEDTLSDDRWVTLEGETEIARSVLCVPFLFDPNRKDQPPRGILTLEHPEPNRFNKTDLQLVQAVANQASTAMINAQLYDKTKAQQRQLEAILNSTTEALFTIDAQGQLAHINPSAGELLGVSLEEARNFTLESLAERNSLVHAIQEAMRQSKMTAGTQSFELHDERSHRDFVASVSKLPSGDNLEGGAVITLHDVTSLKDLNRLKTHMLQMASHDLKNPLGVLLGYLDMMREDTGRGVVPDPQFVEGMWRAVERMDYLIQTLLNQDRIEQSAKQRYQTLDPYGLVNGVVADMTDSAKAKNHRLQQEIAPGLPQFPGDAIELREAMNNLISNAIKYTPDGGLITIRMSAEDGRLFFSVSDTGVGIPADQQSAIFNKYFRTKQATTAQIEGTGLGLSLAKEVVERHGGTVWFQSEEGVGSTFGFWLPLLK